MRPRLWLVAFTLASALAALAASTPAGATFPGANGKIAFETTRDGNTEVYVASADGTGAVNLTHRSASDEDPAWSPDGRKIVFASGSGFPYELWTMNADGSALTQLTHDGTFSLFPSYSPDGTKIVYTSTRSGDAEIWTMNADGTAKTQLTHSPGDDVVPQYSPDGSKIAFASMRDGNYEIYVMNADGSGQTNLTRNPAIDWGPDWAPVGPGIVFTSTRDGNAEIYGMKPDGSAVRNLTTSPRFEGYGAISPDGMAFSYTTTGSVAQMRDPFPGDEDVDWICDGTDLEFDPTDIPAPGPGEVPPPWPDDFDPEQPIDFVPGAFDDPGACLSEEPLGYRVDPSRRKRQLEGGSGFSRAAVWQPLRAGDLLVYLRGPATARKRKALTYRAVVASSRTGLTDGAVRLTLTLPAGVRVVRVEPRCTRAGKSLTCELGPLGPWTARTVLLELRVNAPKRITLSASVAGELFELHPPTNSATKTTNVR
jgi:TolB protein